MANHLLDEEDVRGEGPEEGQGEVFFSEVEEGEADEDHEAADAQEPEGESADDVAADRLLNLETPEDVDRFVEDFVHKRIWKGVKKLGKGVLKMTPLTKLLQGKLGTILKALLRKGLPLGIKALGGAFGGPIGAGLASLAASKLGLEAGEAAIDEGEAAAAVVRFMNEAVDDAASQGEQFEGDLEATVNQIVKESARKNAPFLLQKPRRMRFRKGTWRRVGNKIILRST